MSDLFLGAILSLVLLVPVLLRPFLKSLQRVEGIPVLPFVSLATCALVCAGSGFSVTILPVVFYCLVAFVTTSARLVRRSMGLPTDWFSPWSTAWHAILIVGFVATAYVSWVYRPELSWLPTSALSEKSRIVRVSPGVTAKVTVYGPAAAADGASVRGESPKVVLFVGNGVSPGRRTAERMIASGGWTVVEARFRAPGDYRNPLLSVSSIRDACVLLGEGLSGHAFLTDDGELASARYADLGRLVRFASGEFGNVPLYVVAEGPCVPAVSSWMAAKPGAFAGVVFVLPDGNAAQRAANPEYPELSLNVSGMMPQEAGSYPVIVLSGEARLGFGHGELCADDVLAARLFGAERDEGRKTAELTARRLATCLAMREAFNDRN